jgi:hypothetical protein
MEAVEYAQHFVTHASRRANRAPTSSDCSSSIVVDAEEEENNVDTDPNSNSSVSMTAALQDNDNNNDDDDDVDMEPTVSPEDEALRQAANDQTAQEHSAELQAIEAAIQEDDMWCAEVSAMPESKVDTIASPRALNDTNMSTDIEDNSKSIRLFIQ